MLEPGEVDLIIALTQAQIVATALLARSLAYAGSIDLSYLDAMGRAAIPTQSNEITREMLSVFVGLLGHGPMPLPAYGEPERRAPHRAGQRPRLVKTPPANPRETDDAE